MKKQEMPLKICPICGAVYQGWGNNPWPLNLEEKVCDICNHEVVISLRIELKHYAAVAREKRGGKRLIIA